MRFLPWIGRVHPDWRCPVQGTRGHESCRRLCRPYRSHLCQYVDLHHSRACAFGLGQSRPFDGGPHRARVGVRRRHHRRRRLHVHEARHARQARRPHRGGIVHAPIRGHQPSSTPTRASRFQSSTPGRAGKTGSSCAHARARSSSGCRSVARGCVLSFALGDVCDDERDGAWPACVCVCVCVCVCGRVGGPRGGCRRYPRVERGKRCRAACEATGDTGVRVATTGVDSSALHGDDGFTPRDRTCKRVESKQSYWDATVHGEL